MDIAPDGVILSTCVRFTALLRRRNIRNAIGSDLLSLFSRLGTMEPALHPEWFRQGIPPSVDLTVQGAGARSFTIRWIPTPRYARDSDAAGWQLTGPILPHEEKKSYLISASRNVRDPQIAAILESITDGFFVLDAQFRVTLWNQEAERITCLTAAEMIGRSIWDKMPGLVGTDAWQSFHTAFKKKMTVTFEQYHQRTSQWLEMSCYPSEQGVLAYFREVTERKEQEALLLRELDKQKQIAQTMVDAQEKERAEIGRELHDNINQILSTTKLYLELAKNDSTHRLNLIDRSAGNIHNAIREIRNISRNLVPASVGDLGLRDSIADLVESLQTSRNIHVEFYSAGNIDQLIGEKTKLMLFRIIQEQVNNVLKHSEARSLIIELVFEEAGNQIELSITDDGKGFDPRKAAKDGLGLSNIISRAEMSGGKAVFQAAPGQGCRLRVQLPTG